MSPTQLHDDPRRGPALNSLLLHGELEPRKMARRPAAVALLRRHEPPGTGRWRGGQRSFLSLVARVSQALEAVETSGARQVPRG